MSILSLYKRLNKGTQVGIATLLISVATMVPLALQLSHAKAGYGPDRPRIYDWNNQADRSGATTPTLNSFINTPVYGDERNFTRIAPAVDGQSPVDGDYSKENVTANADGQYWVRVYVHNNANETLNAAPNNTGVATNTKVRFAIAEGQANGVDVMGYISADNSTPAQVWDSGTLVNDSQKFAVEYVPASAEIVNQAHLSGLPLSDAVTGANGVQIGYDQMNGSLPGCFDFSAYVFIKVKVTAPKVQANKTVKMVGGSEWKETENVKPGDKISWQISVVNTGSAQIDNVTVSDELPKGLTLDPGSITYVSSAFPSGKVLPDTALSSGGVNVASFTPNGNGSIFLRTVVGQPVDDTCEIVNTAHVRGDNSPESSDTAKVVFDKNLCKKTPPVATHECTLLTVTPDATDKRKISVKIDAGHDATTKVKSYVIDFGDGSNPLTTDQNPHTFTYANDGTYTIVAKVNFELADGSLKEKIGSDKCIKTITITSPKSSVLAATTTTKALPDTGAGNVVGIFAGTSVLGAFLYRLRAVRGNR